MLVHGVARNGERRDAAIHFALHRHPGMLLQQTRRRLCFLAGARLVVVLETLSAEIVAGVAGADKLAAAVDIEAQRPFPERPPTRLPLYDPQIHTLLLP